MSKQYQNGRTLGQRHFSVEEIGRLAIGMAMEKKAFRPVLIDLKPAGAFTEYFAIVSASNPRQARAIAEDIRLWFKHTFGMNPLAADGLETATWVLLDYGPVLVHVFQESTREMYKLETLWSKGRFVDLREDETVKLLAEVKELAAAAVQSSSTSVE